jgi:uncharacterized membrane-anchored protein YhcB (DUF1043 family)
MPELTWAAALAWFGVIASAASIAGLLTGLLGMRQTNKLIVNVHTATQQTLTDLAKGFRETTEAMDRRHVESAERMDQRADERHREVIQAIQALKS